MKAIYFCMILSMLAGLCLQVSVCPNNNPWIKYIQNSKAEKVNLLSKPVLDSNHCGDEWRKYGTCCEVQSLITYAKMEHTHIKRYSDRVIADFEKFEHVVAEVFTWLMRLAHLPTENCWFKDAIKSAGSLLKSPSVISFFNKFLPNEVINYALFSQNTKKCWEFVAKARTASLCGVCSARSNGFFRDGKGLIDESSCFTYMSECHQSMELLIDFVEALEGLINLKQQHLDKLGIGLYLETYINIDGVKSASQGLRKARIHDAIKHYKKNDKATVINLCNKFIRLGTKTILQELFEMSSLSDSQWQVSPHNYIVDLYKLHKVATDKKVADWKKLQAKSNTFKPVSNWLSKSRRLFESGQMDFEFSDIQVKSEVDSAYNAFLGAKGTSNLGHGLVFNLTNKFP